MPVWQVQFHQTTIWSGASSWHITVKIDEIFKEMPNLFDIEDDILIVVYDADGRDHDKTLRHVMQICH